ncbi:MAG: hypothetical protein ACRDPF_36290, partial [Streptosporangiaceae bacterium]
MTPQDLAAGFGERSREQLLVAALLEDLDARTRQPVRYSVVLRLKKWVAAGAATARITTDQISAACTGCCIGQAWIVPDGFGFPHSTRVAATTALTGFQVVIAWSQP